MLNQHFSVQPSGPALSEPITWSDFSEWSRIDSTGDRLLVEGLLVRAREQAEHDSGRSIAMRAYELRLDDFPWGSGALQLPRSPVAAVDRIEYLDEAGTLTTWDSSNWQLDTYSEPARLAPVSAQSWPTVQERTLGAARVHYRVGYALAEDVPGALKQAILLLASHWYENREATADRAPAEIPLGYRALVGSQDTGDLW